MKKFYFRRSNNLSLLHDEFLAAIPDLRPIHLTGNPPDEFTPVMSVQGRDVHIWLEVPDDTDETLIAAVVQAHDHTKKQPDPFQDARLAGHQKLIELGLTTEQIAALTGFTP